jgi:4-hydroxy-2-oxoheptanedioate aldolase
MKNITATMRTGEVVVGSFVVSASPSAVEIVGYSGADFVVIDCEHAALSPYGTELEACVRAAYAADVTPIVRITSKEGGQVLKAANFGAIGIMIPHVNAPEELERMIQHAKIPPAGNRSCAPPVRAARHGWEPWPDFVERTNAEVQVIPILEEPAAFERLSELLAVPGLEVVCFGPYDLAQRLGGVGTAAEARIDEYLRELIRICDERGVVVMNLAWNSEQVRQQVEAGCRGIIYSTDVSLLNIALREQYDVLRQELHGVRLEELAPAKPAARLT